MTPSFLSRRRARRWLPLPALVFIAAAAVAAPRRIVSLLPSHTDIVAALGAVDRLVAVSEGEDVRHYPDLPRVGGMEISWEALVRLKPDLVLADVSHRRYAAQFNRFQLPVVYLPATEAATVEDVLALVEDIGRRLERDEAARRWLEKARRRIRFLTARRPAGPGPRVYFEIWPQPLQACGPRSLAGDLLARVGARNVVQEKDQTVPLMSAEAVLRADPEIILHTGLQSNQEVAARPGWAGVMAVRKGAVIAVDPSDFSRASPRLLDGWEKLLDVLEAR